MSALDESRSAIMCSGDDRGHRCASAYAGVVSVFAARPSGLTAGYSDEHYGSGLLACKPAGEGRSPGDVAFERPEVIRGNPFPILSARVA